MRPARVPSRQRAATPEELRRDGNRISLRCSDRDAIAASGLTAQRVAGDDHTVPSEDRAENLHRVLRSPQRSPRSRFVRRANVARRQGRQWLASNRMKGPRSAFGSTLRHPRWLDRGEIVRLRTCLQWQLVLDAALLLDVVTKLGLQGRPGLALKSCSASRSLGLESCVLGHCPVDALSGESPDLPSFCAGSSNLDLSGEVAVFLRQSVLPLVARSLDRVTHEQRTLAVGCDP